MGSSRGVLLCVLALALSPPGISLAGVGGAAVLSSTTSDDGRTISVLLGGRPVFELTDARFARFRCAPDSERGVGYLERPLDLSWAPNDFPDVDDARVEALETGTRLRLVVSGTKPQLPGSRYRTEVLGETDAGGRIRYTFASTLELGPGVTLPSVELLDVWYDRIFWPAAYRGTPELYREFVYGSSAGSVRAPKLHVYTDTYTPDTPASTLIQPLGVGSFFSVLDPKRGGLRVRFDDLSSNGNVGVCWWTWDSHCFLRPAEPSSRFSYRMTVDEIDAAEARRLHDAARPVDFASEEAYRVPVFRIDDVNAFDRTVGASSDWAWERTSLDARLDPTVGYRDSSSVTIIGTNPARRAWYARQLWIDPWHQGMLEGRYRLSAMVKTRGVVGAARVFVVEHDNPARLLYDVPETAHVVSSSSLAGTNGWTELSVDFSIARPNAMVALELDGVGQVWFDDVRVAPLVDASGPTDVPEVAFYASDSPAPRVRVPLTACRVDDQRVLTFVGKLTLAWAGSGFMLPRRVFEPGAYRLVLFANSTGCEDDPPQLLVTGLPGGPRVVSIRPDLSEDYPIDFVVDRRRALRVRVSFANDGACDGGVDKNVFVRDVTIALPGR